MKARALLVVFAVTLLSGCGILNDTVREEREVPVLTSDGQLVFYESGELVTVKQTYEGPPAEWRSAQGMDAQARTAEAVARAETAKQQARGGACPNWEPDQVEALAAEGETGYFRWATECQRNQGMYVTRDIAEAGFAEVRAAAGQPSDYTYVGDAVATSDQVREREITNRISKVANPLAAFGSIAVTVRAREKTAQTEARNPDVGSVTVTKSDDGSIEGSGEGGATATGGQGDQIVNIGNNNQVIPGEGSVASDGRNPTIFGNNKPDSSFDPSSVNTQAENGGPIENAPVIESSDDDGGQSIVPGLR